MLRRPNGSLPTTFDKNSLLIIARPYQPLIALEMPCYETECVKVDGKYYAVDEDVALVLGNVKTFQLVPTVLRDGTVNLFPITYAQTTWRDSGLDCLEAAIDQPGIIKSNRDEKIYQFTPAKYLSLDDFNIPESIEDYIEQHFVKLILSDLNDPIVKKLLKAQGGK